MSTDTSDGYLIGQAIHEALQIPQYATPIIRFTITQSSDDSEAYDLTGHQVEFTIKPSKFSAAEDAIVTYTLDDGVTIVDAAAGQVDVALSAPASDTVGRFWYRADVITPVSDERLPWRFGPWTVFAA